MSTTTVGSNVLIVPSFRLSSEPAPEFFFNLKVLSAQKLTSDFIRSGVHYETLSLTLEFFLGPSVGGNSPVLNALQQCLNRSNFAIVTLMVINSALLNQILLSILKNVATHNTFTTLPNNKLLYFLIVPLYFIRHPLTNRMHTSLSISLISCEPRRLHCKASNFSSFTNISKGALSRTRSNRRV